MKDFSHIILSYNEELHKFVGQFMMTHKYDQNVMPVFDGMGKMIGSRKGDHIIVFDECDEEEGKPCLHTFIFKEGGWCYDGTLS